MKRKASYLLFAIITLLYGCSSESKINSVQTSDEEYREMFLKLVKSEDEDYSVSKIEKGIKQLLESENDESEALVKRYYENLITKNDFITLLSFTDELENLVIDSNKLEEKASNLNKFKIEVEKLNTSTSDIESKIKDEQERITVLTEDSLSIKKTIPLNSEGNAFDYYGIVHQKFDDNTYSVSRSFGSTGEEAILITTERVFNKPSETFKLLVIHAGTENVKLENGFEEEVPLIMEVSQELNENINSVLDNDKLIDELHMEIEGLKKNLDSTVNSHSKTKIKNYFWDYWSLSKEVKDNDKPIVENSSPGSNDVEEKDLKDNENRSHDSLENIDFNQIFTGTIASDIFVDDLQTNNSQKSLDELGYILFQRPSYFQVEPEGMIFDYTGHLYVHTDDNWDVKGIALLDQEEDFSEEQYKIIKFLIESVASVTESKDTLNHMESLKNGGIISISGFEGSIHRVDGINYFTLKYKK
ncbi:hypothetical protein [Paenisporosarcina antarctica]|uniref:Uncharacterized protein n=1 Tax=Paenisporosarcina antarctica TaxID=417367 RepID=A0A4P7A2Q9_9BACL|nr:hypothetical protein [Paenisporosarcina antarctica]QBP43182.1 hypothetical protein E2636_18680 [Paenisporosarcina antarctica]